MPAVRIPAPSDGLNTEAAPEAVDNNQAPVLENFLPRDGKAVLRGPVIDRRTMPNFDALPIAGVLGHDFRALVATTADSSRVMPSSLYRFDASTGSWATVPVTPQPSTDVRTYMPSTRSVVHGPGSGYSYGWGGAVSVGGVRPMIAADGLAVSRMASFNSGSNTWTYTAPWARNDHQPDLIVHLDRLWTLAAEFDDNNQDGYAIRWTDPGGLGTTSLDVTDTARTFWKDDVSGLYNVIVLPRNGDRPRAFGKAADQLLIFTGDTTWMLSGRSPSNFTLRQVVSGVGCIRAETVVNWDDGCYFLSREGFMRYDGSTLVNVSGPVRAELIAAIEAAQLNEGGTVVTTLNRVGNAAMLPGGYILLTVGDTFSALYDLRRRAWLRFSINGAGRTAPTWTYASTSTRRTYGFDRVYAYDLTYVGMPEVRRGVDYGADFGANVITGRWRSKTQKLASPLQAATVTRVALDSAFEPTGTDPFTPLLSVFDGRGATLLDGVRLDSAQADEQTVERRRLDTEVFAEDVADASIELLYLDNSVMQRAEVYDAALEFTVGQNRPSV